MTVGATDFALKHGMVMRELEGRADLQMALKASTRRLFRVNDLTALTPTFDVQTPRPMTRFAADVLGFVAIRFQARMGCRREIARNRLVTGSALARSDKFGARNARRR
jgi:hypothetical protein